MASDEMIESVHAQIADSFNEMKANLSSEYKIVNGVITDFGKYQYCAINVVTLWELNNRDGLSWESSSEIDSEVTYSVFELGDLREWFPDEEYNYLICWEDDYGFLRYDFYTESEYEDWLENLFVDIEDE